ncbi:Tgs1 [Symbiodinium sp. CCMP2592]|nr:Tgs1 [Symbiodinium sp. CCMP2592]
MQKSRKPGRTAGIPHDKLPQLPSLQEIEREVKAVRELHAAEQARARKASEVRSLEQQLEEVQQQKNSAKSAQRERAGADLGSLLDSLGQRMMRAHSRWALHHLSDGSKMLKRKGKIVFSAHCAFVLSACAHAWREAASSAIADRQAAQHLEVMQRARQQALLADAHCKRRLACRSWLAWRLEVHHTHTDRSKRVSATATAFLAALPSAETSDHVHISDPVQVQVAPDSVDMDAAEHVGTSQSAQAVISTHVEDAPTAETSPTETKTPAEQTKSEVQACNSREARPASRSRELRAIDRRVQERRKAQEERRQQRQRRQAEEVQQDCVDGDRYHRASPDPARRQQASSSSEGAQVSAHPDAQQEGCGPSLPLVASSGHARPKALREMEKRAEERRLIHEERKKRQKEKEEEQKQKQAEEEQEKRLAEEQAKQERLRLRKEQAQEQRRLRAQRLVAAAIRRDRDRQAVELYKLHQYIRVWCALRQAVSHTAFWDLLALNRRRTALLKSCFTSWHRYRLHAASAKSAARLARAHLAVTWFARRFAFRTLVLWLKKLQLAKLRQYWAAVAASRRWCLCLWLRCWAQCSAESALQKTATAVQQHVQLLLRRSFSWWQTGLKQLRVENAMESHKSALRDRISSWLQEMEDEAPNSLGSLQMPNFQLLALQGENSRVLPGAGLPQMRCEFFCVTTSARKSRWAQWRRCQKKHFRHQQGSNKLRPNPCYADEHGAMNRLVMRRSGLLQRREVHQYKVSYVSGRLASFPVRLHRYYKQRYTLFSRYDRGIEIDKDMWYSVTPEPIAKEQARKVAAAQRGGKWARDGHIARGQPGIVVDSFCGAGGNSIQFARSVAQQGGFVLCVDWHRSRLCSVRHNSRIYGVGRRIELLQADSRDLHRVLRPAVSGVFLSPPWADQGLLPRGQAELGFSLRSLGHGLDAAELLVDALKLGRGAALFLPRVTSSAEVQGLAVLAKSNVLVQARLNDKTSKDLPVTHLYLDFTLRDDVQPSMPIRNVRRVWRELPMKHRYTGERHIGLVRALIAMAPKKGKAATKTKEGKDLAWVQKQLEKISAQLSAGPPWLSEPHSWHQEQLRELQTRLEEGGLESLPSELREGVEFYLSQFEDGQSVSEEEFYLDQELYCELQPKAPEPEQPYSRASASEAELKVCEELKSWTDTTPHGLSKLQKLLEKHSHCAEVQEVGLTRLGGLLAEVKAGGSAVPSGSGFSPASVCPVVLEAGQPVRKLLQAGVWLLSSCFGIAAGKAMTRFPRDAGVQRVACSVLRGLLRPEQTKLIADAFPDLASMAGIVVTDGGCTVVADAGGAARAVDAMKAHLVDPEVCRMGAAVLYAAGLSGDSFLALGQCRLRDIEAMVQKTDPASPERLMMRTTKAHQVLAEALQYHPTDRALDRACRVTMPELKG